MSAATTSAPSDPLADEHWSTWLAAILPDYCKHRFAPHHEEFWDWLWEIEPGVSPPSFIGIWARGGAKSTSAEAGCVALGARGKRRYGLYVSETQDQADDHVKTVAGMLESDLVSIFYPDLGERQLGKFGHSKGWKHNRLWTASGFAIDAIGLDKAARGVKLLDQRPDFLVIDDVDGHLDSTHITQRKITMLTQAIIPAGATDLAVVAIQNLVQSDGVFARLMDGRADFLTRRVLSGPIPALVDFTVDAEGRIDGTPTWEGLSVADCQAQIEKSGLRAFRREAQHEVKRREGALWSPEQVHETRRPKPTELERTCVGVDPSGGEGPTNDEQGIVAVGLAEGRGFVLEDRTTLAAPEKWGARAVRAAIDLDAEIVVEAQYGGDMAISVMRTQAEKLGYGLTVRDGKTGKVVGQPTFGEHGTLIVWRETTNQSKTLRAEPIAALFGDPDDEDSWKHATMHLTDGLSELADEMTTFAAGGKSPNRLDAMVWAASRLFSGAKSGGGMRFRENVEQYLDLLPFGRFAPDDHCDPEPEPAGGGGARFRG